MRAIERTQPAKLLIVEADGVLALDIERQLRGLGFTIVGVAASAEEALRLAAENRPDLAIVDIRIQGARDGIETAACLRADFDVPVVYLTALGDARTIARASATRPLGYLLKPFKYPDLQNVVSIAVARNEHERSLERRERLVSTTLGQLEFVDRLAALGTLAAGAAHEINNPLAFIASNLDYALEHTAQASARELPFDADWADVVSALREAREGARRVTQIVADLRSLARPPVEGLRLLDPRQAVRFALAVTANEWKTRARLVLELGEAPTVMADETRLGQVLVNLIINAAHAMHETRDNVLTLVTGTTDAGEALIEVRDSGAGMSEAVRARAFEPFFTTKAASGLGSGLGLPISLSIVSRLGGRMEIDALEPHGTVFRVLLPGAGASATLEGAPPLA